MTYASGSEAQPSHKAAKALFDLQSSEVSLPNAKINKQTNIAQLSCQRIHSNHPIFSKFHCTYLIEWLLRECMITNLQNEQVLYKEADSNSEPGVYFII